MYRELKMYIGGSWVDSADHAPVLDPATEETIGSVPLASDSDMDRALTAAAKAFGKWRMVSPVERSRILRRAADLIRVRAERIAHILTLEQGKPLKEALSEVQVTADLFDWYAEEGRRSYGRVIPSRDPKVRQLVLQEPVGPVAAFAPWNFPAVSPARKIAGALAAGCSCIIKPSEETPGTCLEIASALEDAGLPPGVLNVLFGIPQQVSQKLIGSDIIRKVSFTGSVNVGKELTKLAADGLKRVTMELGGHAPVVVFADADVDQAARISAASKFRNAGQVCISPSRFYVHEDVYDRFVEGFTASAKALRVGSGLAPDTDMGPLANPRRMAAMEAFVADARAKGASVVCGGGRIGNRGYFWEPTVIANVPDTAQIMYAEPFGPVAPVTAFSTTEDLLRRANGLKFGLAAYAFTRSTETATAISNALEAGMVGINHTLISLPETPFGGVKDSGYGFEGGVEGLEAYMQKKFVSQI
jgi:succinate-semialdehyde dehydrogenase/glutarate-semialdehyde dehydrogenase